MLEKFLPRSIRLALVPLVVVGSVTWGNVVNTPVAEAGGCRGSEVITSGNIAPETLSKLQEDCNLNDLRNQNRLDRANLEYRHPLTGSLLRKIDRVIKEITEYLTP